MANRIKKINRRDRMLVAAAAIVLLLVFVISGKLFVRYTDNQLYSESVSQLMELSTQMFEKLDIQIERQWDYLAKLDETRGARQSMTTDELCEMLLHGENDLSLAGTHMMFRAIDEDGYYYTNAGRQGQWTGLDKLKDVPRQCFLIANWLDNNNYMAFSYALDEPLTVDGHRVTRFVLLRSMQEMQPFFHSSAFSDRNVTFVIDQSGLVLFEDGALSGIEFDGRNIFHTMQQNTYPHVESFDAVVEQGKTGQTVCTDVVINGEEYYLVYDILAEYDWSVLMLVSKGDVATSATQMVSSMTRVFVMVTALLVVVVAIVLIFVARLQNNRKLLEIREHNEQQLAENNAVLEITNRELEKAQSETTEALIAAKAATKAKSQFLSNMSHDIRTPMNAIIGITKLMENETGDPDKMSYYVNKLQHSGQYMLGLINDILDMSKIESGEVRLNVEPVKVAEQAGQIESIIRSQSNEREQEFTVVVHELRHEYLMGDSIRIRQIFMNLLGNAVKYTQSGGRIVFEITELPCDKPGYATILTSVIDNGYGMSEEFLQHIFEPFTRAESSVTNKVQGTGLGMSITKSIVDLMDGTITVESKLGEGSRFDVTLTLPIDTESERAVPLGSILLIASDDVFIRNVRAALSEMPVDLRVVATPDEAVTALREKTADAVILSGYLSDSILPDTVHRLRETAQNAALVFCCDYAQRDALHEILGTSGVDGFISRPFFYENLLIAVDNARKSEDTADDSERRSPLRGKRFLCAEDNELNAEILEALLDMHGATCVIYPTGVDIVEAFAAVKPGDYDAILMDVQMPKMNGMDATRAIRSGANPLGATIPIIAMTANAFSSDVQDCLDAGMDAHLAKPLDIAALERTLHDILSENRGGGDTCPQPVDSPAAADKKS